MGKEARDRSSGVVSATGLAAPSEPESEPEVVVIEAHETITDSDYRTICMPCLPLEEPQRPRKGRRQRPE